MRVSASLVPVAATDWIAQRDRQEALVVVGDAVHLVKQHRDRTSWIP
ncbi:hypothetical protein ACFOPN_12115 [Xanthomonas hyacinthi]